jgi:hypothetical protein
MAERTYASINPMHDWVVFEVEDMDSNHVELVVAADVAEAATKITERHGPKLRGYRRIAVIDRRPTTLPLEVAMA